MNTQALLQSIGFEEEDINLLNSEDKIEDFSPFVEKLNSKFYDKIKSDEAFIEQITKPHKDAIIGKENSYKRQIRKAFGLDIKDDDLKKADFNKLLEQGLSTIKTDGNMEELKSRLIEEMEAKENLLEQVKNEYEKKISEITDSYNKKIQQNEIDKIMINELEAEPLVEKNNLSIMVKTIRGNMYEDGYHVEITPQKKLRLINSDGVPIKDDKGTHLSFSKYVNSILAQIRGNVFPKGEQPSKEPNTPQKSAFVFNV